MGKALTVHIAKSGKQYILVPKIHSKGKRKSYGYFGVPGKDFTDYVYDK